MAKSNLLRTLLETVTREEVVRRKTGYDDAAKNPFKYLSSEQKRVLGLYFLGQMCKGSTDFVSGCRLGAFFFASL